MVKWELSSKEITDIRNALSIARLEAKKTIELYENYDKLKQHIPHYEEEIENYDKILERFNNYDINGVMNYEG